MCRPAWRIIQTGVRSTFSPRAARISRGSVCAESDDDAAATASAAAVVVECSLDVPAVAGVVTVARLPSTLKADVDSNEASKPRSANESFIVQLLLSVQRFVTK